MTFPLTRLAQALVPGEWVQDREVVLSHVLIQLDHKVTIIQKRVTDMASKLSADLGDQAKAIYQDRLKNRLESTNLDDFVAIEPESGDFFLGKTLSEAIQASRAAYPARLPFALRVGHVSTVEIGAMAP